MKKMNVSFSFRQGELTAYLKGEIDHHTARSMRQRIDGEAERLHPTVLILDFSQVVFMDSSAIGLIMGRYRLMQLIGGYIRVSNIPPHLRRIVELSGIGALGVLEYKGKEKGKIESA